ncbi:MAG TPA: hypothetical protein VJQ83_13180 [Tepidiformaceae bacterium]|nr:hypothetical protein [Tepidiformaceae bacterium]
MTVRVWGRVTGLMLGLLSVLALAAFATPAAYADGSAGIVVEHGDGSVDTYCVAFQGDSISASDLLAKAGISDVQWNGSVCAIGNNPAEGCFEPTDYSSCYCKSYPPTNTYWAFFTQTDDQGWVYSPLGIQSAVAHNGDLEAWKWGVGGPSSAPPPPAMSFAQVCAASAPATSTPTAPAPTATPPPATVVPLSTASTVATVVPLTASPTRGTATTTAATSTEEATVATNSPVITNHGRATATPAPPVKSGGGGGGGSGGAAGFAAFGGVAILLIGAITGAVIYRRRHGE